ncbi:MAG: hypothetical protein AAGD08_20495 [Pseudomonadota bacterium]
MDDLDNGQSPLWMGVLVAAAILFSFALSCGMPFAALGALAALTLPSKDAALLAGLGWLANQVIGFGFLGYPLETTTLAWGAALGLSAVAAVGAALAALQRMRVAASTLRLAGAFFAAWAAQQGVVFVASLLLGGTATAFAPAVVWLIFWTNGLAFAVLLLAQVIGAQVGLARPPIGQLAG